MRAVIQMQHEDGSITTYTGDPLPLGSVARDQLSGKIGTIIKVIPLES